jgi:hypothetical protein
MPSGAWHAPLLGFFGSRVADDMEREAGFGVRAVTRVTPVTHSRLWRRCALCHGSLAPTGGAVLEARPRHRWRHSEIRRSNRVRRP